MLCLGPAGFFTIEFLLRKPPVVGSSPTAGFLASKPAKYPTGGFPISYYNVVFTELSCRNPS
jgi:hypothetical protein